MATAPKAKIDAAKAEAVAEKVSASKKVAAPKTAKKAPAKQAAVKKPAAKTAPISTLKDTIMAQTKTTTADFTAKVQDAVADAQTRAKAAFEKTQAYAADYGDFTKGNVEALIESGKVLAAGLQDLGKDVAAEGKTAFETITADVKELAAVKSPADFFKLQGEILRRNFDNAVASGSKRSETLVKLASDAFAPIQTRVSLAAEKIKKAA